MLSKEALKHIHLPLKTYRLDIQRRLSSATKKASKASQSCRQTSAKTPPSGSNTSNNENLVTFMGSASIIAAAGLVVNSFGDCANVTNSKNSLIKTPKLETLSTSPMFHDSELDPNHYFHDFFEWAPEFDDYNTAQDSVKTMVKEADLMSLVSGILIDTAALSFGLGVTGITRNLMNDVCTNPQRSFTDHGKTMIQKSWPQTIRYIWRGSARRVFHPSVPFQSMFLLSVPRIVDQTLDPLPNAMLFGGLETITSHRADSRTLHISTQGINHFSNRGWGAHWIRNVGPIGGVLIKAPIQKKLENEGLSGQYSKALSTIAASVTASFLTAPFHLIWTKYQLDPSFNKLPITSQFKAIGKEFTKPSGLRVVTARFAYSTSILMTILSSLDVMQSLNTPDNSQT